jgi:hypothetical protein
VISCGVKVSEVFPCLWTNHSSLVMAMILICVDDCLNIGTKEAIEECIHALKRHNFGLEAEENPTGCLDCDIFSRKIK